MFMPDQVMRAPFRTADLADFVAQPVDTPNPK
jgi:hypothetical protein